MKAAKVVDPARAPDKARVFFGATVKIADEDDNHRTLTLVGDDEADAGAGRIASPNWGWSPPAGSSAGRRPVAIRRGWGSDRSAQWSGFSPARAWAGTNSP